MNIPFVYGRIAEHQEFTGREQDIIHLKQNLTSGINTVIMSPRRWGKSSLVHYVLNEISESDDEYLVCHVDAFNCRDEESFFQTYANAVIKASTTFIDEAVSIIKKYMGSIGAKITLEDSTSKVGVSLGIDITDRQYSVDEILDLPEKIAAERGKKFVVCIDEFQNIGFFDNPDAFQARLRSHWQLHQHVTYCMYGSRRHMLLNIFSDYEKPFYKFGDIIPLQKIPSSVWRDFIVARFHDTGKQITPEFAEEIALRVECHSYYVQQYAQLVWLLTADHADETLLDVAYQQMMDRSTLLFYNIIDSLRTRQISFLVAIARGEENYSSANVLRKYNLGSSANIKNLRQALLDHDIVTTEPGSPRLEIQDPVFKQWLLVRYR